MALRRMLVLLVLVSAAGACAAAAPTAVPAATAFVATTAPPAPATQHPASPPPATREAAAVQPMVAARKPVEEWGEANSPAALAQDIHVVNLATVVKAPSGSADGLITSMLVFTTPVGSATTQVVPDVAQLRASDSLGHGYTVTYREIARADGVTMGAVSVRLTAGPRRTVSVDLGAVQTGPASAAAVTGPWKVDLVQQLTDDLTPGRLDGAFGHQKLPLQTPGGGVTYRYLGGGFLTITIGRPTGPQTIYLVGLDDGQVRVVSKEEFDRLYPRPPKPFVFGTPLPGSPLR